MRWLPCVVQAGVRTTETESAGRHLLATLQNATDLDPNAAGKHHGITVNIP